VLNGELCLAGRNTIWLIAWVREISLFAVAAFEMTALIVLLVFREIATSQLGAEGYALLLAMTDGGWL
jgi:hypothetical protein